MKKIYRISERGFEKLVSFANELVASHDPARNAVINLERKTEHEIIELSKGYADLAEQVKEKKEV